MLFGNDLLWIRLALVLLVVILQGHRVQGQYQVDCRQGASLAWPHYWEESVGSGHALLTLRADWQAAMARARSELGFRSVRFHAIFDDDMSTFSDATAPSFFNIDHSYDYLVSLGMKPLVELSFMPERMASGNSTVFHYKGNTSPPKDMAQWTQAITQFAQHLVSRYGLAEVQTWLFEVWNEPNIGFWSGTQAQYFELYESTARALKAVHPSLQVGGPVSSNSSWLPDFVDFVRQNNVPCDFVSSHQYPTDRMPLEVDILPRIVAEDVRTVSPLPFYLTEYNDGLGIGQHDKPYAAAFVLRNVAAVQGMTSLFSFWCLTDIFEEQGQSSLPFQDNFGLLTIDGIAKPSYRAFELLHATGTKRYPVVGPSFDQSTVGVVAVTAQDDSANEVHLLVWNHAAIQDPCPAQTVNVTLFGPRTAAPRLVTVARVDDTHANPQAAWVTMGSPSYLTPGEIEKLSAVSALVEEPLAVEVLADGSVSLVFAMPSQSAARIRLLF